LKIWVSIKRKFPFEPVTAPAKGPAELSPIANSVMGDVAIIPLFLNREGAKHAKVIFLFFPDQDG
jgi:hypothetical protein